MISINATFLLTVLNFILLVLVLKAILFKPMISFLEERASKIDNSLKLAEQNKKRSEEMQLEHDEIIKEARAKASDIVEKATSGANKEGREILAQAHEKAQNVIDAAREEIEMEAERIKQDLRSDIAEMTVSLAGKVLEREIRESDHKALIEKGLGEMKS